jgi:rsbT co-antagonist protein RsbR
MLTAPARIGVSPDALCPDLSAEERDALRQFWRVYHRHFDELADAIDLDAEERPELAAFIGRAGSSERLRSRDLISHAIVENDWEPYLTMIAATGARYAEAGLSFGAWFATGRALRMRITPLVVDALPHEPERLAQAVRGAAIFVDLMMITIGGAYLAAKERIITAQQADIRDLSTPVLELRSGLLLMPLIGTIDTRRAADLTDALLATISKRRGTVFIIDVTGVPAVDTAVAAHLMHTIRAARLMGATGIIAGISAANAQTLASLGIDFYGIDIVGTLADAVEEADALPSISLPAA